MDAREGYETEQFFLIKTSGAFLELCLMLDMITSGKYTYLWRHQLNDFNVLTFDYHPGGKIFRNCCGFSIRSIFSVILEIIGEYYRASFLWGSGVSVSTRWGKSTHVFPNLDDTEDKETVEQNFIAWVLTTHSFVLRALGTIVNGFWVSIGNICKI